VKHLIDSQSLIWYVDQDHLLTEVARSAISDPRNDLLVSAATVMGDRHQGWSEEAIALPLLPAMDG
jgi:hypothetical protein